MDVLIFSGQSNMQGQTEGLPLVNSAVENVREYHWHMHTFVPLQHPVGEDIECEGEQMLLGSHQGGGSLVPAFCRAYTKASGREAVAIHVAKGNTSIHEWLPQTKRYAVMVDKIRKGMDLAAEEGGVEHVFFVWLQGESDAIFDTSAEDYLERLQTLKNALKQDVGIEKFGIIQVGYFVSVCRWCAELDRRTERDEAIMRAQERAAAQDQDFVMLTRICPKLSRKTECINPEADGHYNNEAIEIIGEEAGGALAKIVE
jgi:hypothetical protein